MPRNDAAAPDHVCPGIRIHAIDIVQPPGIGISPIADMDAHQTIVTAALAAKSSAEMPKKPRWEALFTEVALSGTLRKAMRRKGSWPGMVKWSKFQLVLAPKRGRQLTRRPKNPN